MAVEINQRWIILMHRIENKINCENIVPNKENMGVRNKSNPAMKAHLEAEVRDMPHCWNPEAQKLIRPGGGREGEMKGRGGGGRESYRESHRDEGVGWRDIGE